MGKVGIITILDGFGIAPESDSNAISLAKTPNLDRIFREYPHTELEASATQVGLPSGFMGNSEVGHLNIGSGRIVYQDFSQISHAIEKGSFFENPAFLDLCRKIKEPKKGGTLHLMGLVSDGGVHSHLGHLFALLRLAKQQNIRNVAIHAILDGRDTSPVSGREFIRKLEAFCEDLGTGRVETLVGRFYAMDRDQRWERTEKAYRAIVAGDSEKQFGQAVTAIEQSYDQSVTDEFFEPTIRNSYKGVGDGDGILFFNFRADRARQISKALTQTDFPYFRRPAFPALAGFVAMTAYDASLNVPVAFTKPNVPNTLGEVISRSGWSQLRIAETEKYAHVTYFFNGGDERIFEGEQRALIASPRDVKTYDAKPQMSAPELTERLLAELNKNDFRFVVVNFANCDMVGHTGNLGAAIKAVEAVDVCLGKIFDWVESHDALMLLTADHGNCEEMADSGGTPLTAHTVNKVPLVGIDAKRKDQIQFTEDGRLCDIAPTFLKLMDLEIPPDMTGKILVT